MVSYTKSGDDGSTHLLGQKSISKSSLQIETIGTIDEATSVIGLVRAFTDSPEIKKIVLHIQRDLYRIMTELAASEKKVERYKKFDQRYVKWLEEKTDSFNEMLQMPTEFIIPGDTKSGALMDLARTTIRRAERRIVELSERNGVQNPSILSYLNRLSSLFFLLEIYEVKTSGSGLPILAKQ